MEEDLIRKALQLCMEYFEREISDDPTMVDSDFGDAYLAVKAAQQSVQRTATTVIHPDEELPSAWHMSK